MFTRREFLSQTAVGVISAASSRGVQAAVRDADDGQLRLAIVGTGQISGRFLRQAESSIRARFVATCARTLESAKACAMKYGIGAWYDDYTAMYDAVAPDGVVIATPNSVHAAPTISALERGIAVLCEKPMATTWEDCQAMVATAQKSGTLFLSLPFNATPSFRIALQYLNEATLGVFTGAEAQLLFPPSKFKLKDWHYSRAVAGGWTLNALVYPVSCLIGWLGPAKRVAGFINTLFPHRTSSDGKPLESDIDDNIALLIEWAGGQQAIARTLDGTSIFRSDAVIYGSRGSLWLSGNDVVIHSPERVISGGESIVWNGQKNCYRVPVPNAGNEGLIEHFVDCIKGVSQPTCGGQQQLHVHEILFKGYEAARSGRAQELQTSFTPWHRIEPSFHDARSRRI